MTNSLGPTASTPAGASTFSCLILLTIALVSSPYPASALLSGSTMSARCAPPNTLTEPTPATPANSSASWLLKMSNRSRSGRLGSVTERRTTGIELGSAFWMTGWLRFGSFGSCVAARATCCWMSVAATLMFVPNLNVARMDDWPVVEVDCM